MTAPTDAKKDREATPPQQMGRLTLPFYRGSVRQPAPNEMRDHLANSRTFLAWVRTGITIMAFGFVVAKFGLLLREMPGSHIHPGELHLATILGSVLVVLGASFLALAALDFLVIKRQIEANVIAFSAGIHILLAGVLIVIALAVAVYIWVTAYG
jgi:inner membrane protein YidH